jgi:hypothetical protein
MSSTHVCSRREANAVLADNHYLGITRRCRLAWKDTYGVMVFANPTSRRLPSATWMELVRWCLAGEPNAGSRQWSRFVKWAKMELPDITTIVSYSDPSAGHTGSLYRACNWLWAPTWHRLRPPPSGNGAWTTARSESVKDRWIFPLQPDPDRQDLLAVRDNGLVKKYSWAEYRETTGGNYKKFAALGEPQ